MVKSRKTPATKIREAKAHQPTREAIALRAYEIYLERGGEPGHELEDWIRAERELFSKNGKPRRKPSGRSMAA